MKFTRIVVLWNIVELFFSVNAYSFTTDAAEYYQPIFDAATSYQQVGGGKNKITLPSVGSIRTEVDGGKDGLSENFSDFPVKRSPYIISGTYYVEYDGLWAHHCQTKASEAMDVLYFRVSLENGKMTDWI